MKDSLIHVLKNEWRILSLSEESQKRRLDELSEFSGMILLRSLKSNGSYYYYTNDLKTGKRKYLGNEENEVVAKIKECRFIESSLRKIEKNKKLLLPVIEQYTDIDPVTIDAGLPKVYQNAAVKYSGKIDPRALKWKEEKERFKADFFEKHPDKYPESLTYQRRNGEWMRSKSEGAIADILDMNLITWIYELPHFCNGVWLLSDFTALSPIDYSGEFIIEHAGRMDLPKYRDKFMFTVTKYMEAGYKPNVNLFFTFDNLDQTFSQIPVQNIIDIWMK